MRITVHSFKTARQVSKLGFILITLVVLTAGLVALDTQALRAETAMPQVGLVQGSYTNTIRRPDSYGKPSQSRVWYNTRVGRWDALIPLDDNNGGTSASDRYLMKDVDGSQTFTTLELEDRDYARSDVYWDDAGQQLYVLGSHPVETQFWRLNYDASSDTYAFAVGLPGTGVAVPGLLQPGGSIGGNSPATLNVSPNGVIWVAVMNATGLQIQSSGDGGKTWLASPIVLDSAAAIGVTHWVSFEHDGSQYVGVFAAENGEVGFPTKFFFWYIKQEDNPAILSNWTNDSANIPQSQGQEQADDHISAAVDGFGNMYFAVKTESGAPTDPLIKLYKRTPAGVWSSYKVTETQEVPEQSRPSIVIDDVYREIYIYVNGAEIVSGTEREAGRFKGSLDQLGELENATFVPLFKVSNKIFTDVIVPRGGTTAAGEIVVLAHNRTDETIWYGRDPLPTPLRVYLPVVENP